MSATQKSQSRLNFRLAKEHKREIERAAAALGQTVSDFAISTLVQSARQVNRDQDVTVLSDRDRDRFLAALDDKGAKPNAALAKAAQRYRRLVR
jgi:uncharacterized protein (DUF1778 family)